MIVVAIIAVAASSHASHVLQQTKFDATPVRRLRNARARFGLDGLVDIHHIIPRQFANRIPPDMMHAQDNLVLMPNRDGYSRLKLRCGRIVHDGGHEAYNAHVGSRLAGIAIDDRRSIQNLQCELRERIRRGDRNLPWRWNH